MEVGQQVGPMCQAPAGQSHIITRCAMFAQHSSAAPYVGENMLIPRLVHSVERSMGLRTGCCDLLCLVNPAP